MFYTVYKITNLINGRFYVGVHKTSNIEDGYMGSGVLINAAIEKYGIDNFEKEILYVFDNQEDMYEKEAEIVNEEFVSDPQTYNLMLGGYGGDTWRSPEKRSQAMKARWEDPEYRAKATRELKERWAVPAYVKRQSEVRKRLWQKPEFREKVMDSHSKPEVRAKMSYGSRMNWMCEEYRQKMSEHAIKMWECEEFRQRQSEIRSQKVWITDGKNNRRINQGEELPEGWSKGRVFKEKHKRKEYICPHCGKVGKGPNMKRYHFDNCKHA